MQKHTPNRKKEGCNRPPFLCCLTVQFCCARRLGRLSAAVESAGFGPWASGCFLASLLGSKVLYKNTMNGFFSFNVSKSMDIEIWQLLFLVIVFMAILRAVIARTL